MELWTKELLIELNKKYSSNYKIQAIFKSLEKILLEQEKRIRIAEAKLDGDLWNKKES